MTEYIEVEYEGQTVRQYPDGALRYDNGHFVIKHPGGGPTIDSELSPVYNARKADLKARQQAEFQEEVQRALVSQVAKDGTLPLRKTAGGEVAGWIGNLGAEMRQKTAPKEHGISNYVKVLKEVGQMAGLIEEKKHETLNVDKLALIVTPGTREHVEGLLQKLVAASGDDSSGE